MSTLKDHVISVPPEWYYTSVPMNVLKTILTNSLKHRIKKKRDPASMNLFLNDPKAKEKGCNIAIVVDWDVSGLLIYLKVKKIIPSLKRIGVDFRTLEKLGLRVEDVEEKYNANENNHFDAVKRELKEAIQEIQRRTHRSKQEDSEYLEEIAYLASHLDYLEQKRIEINSITALLNDNAKFWSFIENDIRDAFKDRLFTRSARIPEYVTPDLLQELNNIVEKDGKAAFKLRREELQEKLDHNKIRGFLFDRTNQVKPDYDMGDYDAAIEGQSKKIIESNFKVKSALEKIGPVVKQLKEEEGRQGGG
jgi:5S rRNA maturation endonuclease (ribonuclease M5)